MGLFGGLQDLLGSKNTFRVDPLNLNTWDYNEALKKSQEAALDSINQGNAAGQNQALLNQQLMDQANGQGQSLAQLQLKEASDQNIKNTAGMIASQRGLNPANAARAIALAGQSQGQNLANQAAQLRLQEQLQKQQLLAQNLASQRGQDIGQQSANASLFGLTGQLNQGQNAQNMQNYYNAANINAGVEAQNTASANQLGGQIIGAGASLLGMPGKKYAGGEVDESINMVSPGEKIVEPDGDILHVKGKAKVKGDHPANDTVPVFLEDGTVVIPRTKAKSKKEMFDFLSNVKGKKPSDPMADILSKSEEIKKSLSDLQRQLNGMGKKKYFDGGMVQAPAYDPRPGSPYDQYIKGLENDALMKKQEDMLAYMSPAAISNRTMLENQGVVQQPPESISGILKPEGNIASELPQQTESVKQTMSAAEMPVEANREPAINQSVELPIQNKTEMPSGLNGMDFSGGYRSMKKAEDQYTKSIDSTMAKINDITEQARIKAEERNRRLNELANEKINSNNYWGNMSTPDKIRSGIAILLGGIGAGLAGGKNMALETINDAINKDIEEQKANKQSMYNALIQQGHNDEYATASVMKSMTDQIDALTKKYAASTKSAEALQNLQQLTAQLKMKQAEYDQAQHSTALKDSIMNKALSGQELTPQEQMYLGDERKNYIAGPGGGLATSGTEKNKTDAAVALSQRNQITESISEIKKLVAENSRAGISTEAKAKANARAAALVGQLRLLIAGPGTLSDSDKEQIYKVIPENPLQLFSMTGNTMAKLDTAQDLVDNNTQKVLAVVGIPRSFGQKQKEQSVINPQWKAVVK